MRREFHAHRAWAGDVFALVRVRRLARELSDTLHTYVRQKYEEMWEAARHAIDDER